MGWLFIILLLAILKHCATYSTHTMTYHQKKKRWWSNPSRPEYHSVCGISSNINMVQNANAILAEEAMGDSFCCKLVCLQPETFYAGNSLKISLHFFFSSLPSLCVYFLGLHTKPSNTFLFPMEIGKERKLMQWRA